MMAVRKVREQAPRYPVRRRGERPRVAVDTNIVLDLVLARTPWSVEAARLFAAFHDQRCTGYLSSHALDTVHYVVQRAKNRRVASTAIAELLTLVRIVPLDGIDFQRALTLPLADFEDALHVVAALKVDAHWVVTRDHKDFKGADIPTLSAGEVLAAVEFER